ncbi:MAG: sigma factor-like helix-turn-helix DNA-binding protein [bacterium]|nr:sigma factor-like helix-turn-helix DNA-binding protein [bacterium]
MAKASTNLKEKNTTSQEFGKKVSSVLTKEILKKDRDRNVLIERYGLNGVKPKTLEAIGKDLGITRERVRQIEKVATTKLEKAIPNIQEIKSFHEKLEKTIDNFGGFVNEERLVAVFIATKKQDLKEMNSFLFLITLNNDLVRYGENKEMRTYWTLKNTDNKKILSLSKEVSNLLEEKKKVISAEDIAKSLSEKIEIVESLMCAKKDVLQAEDKKWGLITWREVNPKSIRDKTYIIMKGHKEPLHYSTITEKILAHKLQKRPVTKQAVHNELIRDDRFVLIGRGIYALQEWGYKPGVVEDVIREILIEQGRPMHKNEIIEHVKKHRIVKETTVILNLQKNSFKRVSRATYTLADN